MSERDIQKLVADHTALQNENAILKEQLALVQEQYEWLKKQVFGRKTEQTSVIFDTDEGTQLSMFLKEEQAVSAPIETIAVPAHQRKKKRTHDEWMSNLPVDEIRHGENEPICERCGSKMEEIGEEKVYDVPAK